MIYKIEIENFYSIRDKQVIDLRARQDINSDRLVPIGPGAEEKVPKVIVVFGANGSGKSNVLKAVSFLAWFTAHSFNHARERPLPFAPFADKASRNAPTRLAVEFAGPSSPQKLVPLNGHMFDGEESCCRYSYELVLSKGFQKPDVVVAETLKYWPHDSKKPVQLLSRDEKRHVRASEKSGFKEFPLPMEQMLRDDASVISTISQFQHPLAIWIWRAAASVATNILDEMKEFPAPLLYHLFQTDKQFLAKLNSEIQRADLGIRGLSFETTPNGPALFADHNGLGFPLPLQAESHGTRRFISVFPLITQALQSGSLAIIDELDLSIHPMMLPEILRWFYDPRRNKGNAQLWTNGQNPSLLEHLTKDEIFFCEKDGNGCTSIYGLNDIEDVRRNDNFYRKYLGGVYGAVPHLG